MSNKLGALYTDALIELFELDTTALGGSVLRFCNYSEAQSPDFITFDGQVYTPVPIMTKEFGSNLNNSEEQPSISIADFGKVITSLLNTIGGEIGGAVIKRTLVFRDNLDDGIDPDPLAALPPEIYIVENHIFNGLIYTFNMGNPLNFMSLLVPKRRIRQLLDANT
jgi:lambda family phage minor tail protein L